MSSKNDEENIWKGSLYVFFLTTCFFALYNSLDALITEIESSFEIVKRGDSRENVDTLLSRLTKYQSTLEDIPDTFEIHRVIKEEEAGLIVVKYCGHINIYCFHVIFDAEGKVIAPIPTHL